MCQLAGFSTLGVDVDPRPPPPPPAPHGQLRATTPERTVTPRLRPQDHVAGVQGLLSLRHMLLLAGYDLIDSEEE
eukprot:3650204-Karenia_brevis.AAC.1